MRELLSDFFKLIGTQINSQRGSSSALHVPLPFEGPKLGVMEDMGAVLEDGMGLQEGKGPPAQLNRIRCWVFSHATVEAGSHKKLIHEYIRVPPCFHVKHSQANTFH